MLKTTAEMVLLTALVGSIPRPSWHTRSLAGGDFKMAMSDRGFREQYIDAVGAFGNDQECALGSKRSVSHPFADLPPHAHERINNATASLLSKGRKTSCVKITKMQSTRL